MYSSVGYNITRLRTRVSKYKLKGFIYEVGLGSGIHAARACSSFVGHESDGLRRAERAERAETDRDGLKRVLFWV